MKEVEEIDFHELAKEGKLNTIDPNLLTEENLTTIDSYGYTPIHWAAQRKFLHQIPTEILNEKTINLKDGTENTPLHWAAYHGQLNLIPEKLLTEENLKFRSKSGYTAFQRATEGDFNQIPKRFLTQENLTFFKNKEGHTILHFVAKSNQLNTIPYPILKQNLELIKNTPNIKKIMEEAKTSIYSRN
jgi:ankyrin repeat protein